MYKPQSENTEKVNEKVNSDIWKFGFKYFSKNTITNDIPK